MTIAALANPDNDPAVQPRRFSVVTQAVVPRPRLVVWGEYAQLHHPAWADAPESESALRPVGDLRGLIVGAATVTLLPAGPDTIRAITYTEVTDVQPGHLVATEVTWTGAFEARETIRFLDHPSGGTFVEVAYLVGTAPMTRARANRLEHNLRRLQQGYLDRAATWRHGTPHRPNVIAPEPEDLPR